MANSNDQIKAMLGTSPTGTGSAATKAQSNPALKNIATNGALLLQNMSKLSTTISQITKAWGA